MHASPLAVAATKGAGQDGQTYCVRHRVAARAQTAQQKQISASAAQGKRGGRCATEAAGASGSNNKQNEAKGAVLIDSRRARRFELAAL